MALILEDQGVNNRIELKSDLAEENLSITIRGNNNHITFGNRVSFRGNEPPWIEITGDNNSINLGDYSSLNSNSLIKIGGCNNQINIGRFCIGSMEIRIKTTAAFFQMGHHSTARSVRFLMHEPGRMVLGKDCMLSANIWISISDMHSLIDLDTGRRINPAADIIIGDHVWLGLQCKIFKGVRIGSGSVVGAAAVVTKDVPENCVVAGNPARIIRENISWDRKLIRDSFTADTSVEL